MCSTLRYILNYRYASGQFCYCLHVYCAIICSTPQELHVLQAQSAAPCSIVTLPRKCTYCRLRAQHRFLLLHSPGTARTAVSERSTLFYCYTPQELHVLQAQSAAPCSIVTLRRNCTYRRLRAQHRVLLLHSPGTAYTAA